MFYYVMMCEFICLDTSIFWLKIQMKNILHFFCYVSIQSIDNVCHIKKLITNVSRAIPSSKDILQDQDAAIQPNTHI